jgi:hypothetical protein
MALHLCVGYHCIHNLLNMINKWTVKIIVAEKYFSYVFENWFKNLSIYLHFLFDKVIFGKLSYFNFAQWRYSNQWSNREVLLLLVENYNQYPAQIEWNISGWGNFWRLLREQIWSSRPLSMPNLYCPFPAPNWHHQERSIRLGGRVKCTKDAENAYMLLS